MPTLYQLEYSPFCIPIVAIFRSVRRALTEVNVLSGDRRQIIELTRGESYHVPVLEDNGRIIYETAPDSQNVPRYVDEHYVGGQLFPEKLDGLQSILIQNLENEVEGVTFRLLDPPNIASITDVVERTMIIRHKERRFGQGCVRKWEQERPQLLAEAERVLKPFDQILQYSPFVLGSQPVYADFLLFGILGNMTYHGCNEIPESLTAFPEWRTRLEAFHF